MNRKDYIMQAFGEKSDEYRLDFQPELVDVNNRFRMIKIDNIDYVIKRSKPDKAEREVKNAKKAFERLNGIRVDGIEIHVVIPEMVILEGNAYLVSPFLGQTLLGNLYQNKPIVLKEEFLFKLLAAMLEQGVVDRGCIPRNLLLSGNVLNIIDWEDVIFQESPISGFNRLWETSFVLNWMYFFDRESLMTRIREIQPVSKWIEPPLIKYEKTLCNFLGWKEDNVTDIRDKIEAFVHFAEMPDRKQGEDCFFPNDCAHLIADIFSPEVDAFFDITAFCCRKAAPEYFSQKIKEIGACIKDSFFVDFHCRSNIIYILLEMISCIRREEERTLLLEHYLNGEIDLLEEDLYQMLESVRLYFNNNSSDLRNNPVAQNLILQILLYSREFAAEKKKSKKRIYSGSYYDIVRGFHEAPIPGSYHLLEKDRNIDNADKVREYSIFIKRIRDFLAENQMPMAGIYMQQACAEADTWVLPFHIPVLKKMGIDVEVYQPQIPLYFRNYPRSKENEEYCMRLDAALEAYFNHRYEGESHEDKHSS